LYVILIPSVYLLQFTKLKKIALQCGRQVLNVYKQNFTVYIYPPCLYRGSGTPYCK